MSVILDDNNGHDVAHETDEQNQRVDAEDDPFDQGRIGKDALVNRRASFRVVHDIARVSAAIGEPEICKEAHRL